MTETSMLQDSAATRAKLQDLRDAGIGVSIDDFGTGYSSLSYLQRFPVTTLKIARDFVDVDGIDAEAWELANAIVALGRALRLSVIAEGVEQWSQLGRLRTLGCEFAQGFYFARPLDPASIESVLAHGSILTGDPDVETGELDARPDADRRGQLTVRAQRGGEFRFRDAPNRTFVPLAHVPIRAWSGHATARSVVAVRSENSANPSRGGDAKPGIFREPAPKDRPVARHRTSTHPKVASMAQVDRPHGGSAPPTRTPAGSWLEPRLLRIAAPRRHRRRDRRSCSPR